MRLLRIGLALWLLACVGVAQAALSFPALTGRVVDSAQMIDPAVREQLTQQLQALERTSGDQLVVVTVPDLQGVPIEDYGYQLGRQWGIGQKGKDNGALLIVSRDDRQLRIEVGYGLEGVLTDAQSWVIINQVILPKFKAGNFSQGISDGVAAMIQVVGGEPLAVPAHVADANFAMDNPGFSIGLFILLIGVLWLCNRMGLPVGAILLAILNSSGRGGGGGGGGGGFRGGGGGFGGGGASGSW
ncbi:MAG: methanol dehydrogenase [Pseudomonadales bacterium RIFCSPLOWO2_12_60_38]|uniref:TPM domain-containing protein n=3 Tax=Pseudomonas TaxID=286 RepID=UPI0003DC15BE|nr:TPM domain-containing protein [Pseudomonas sp. CFSAN084952]ETK40015.1 methanol dehydrogenase [Pseudomonas fluorescens FH5]OHC32747.1 MAG: methanol dehydrogenase [Pseudomonadales bacterium RIFCSPLOWO2_12_60_38]OHC41740.1 MAG: methanol dehydrogenase [Pseudomonadales bacterium RIFCSPLOWO2_12_FULL_59_450]QGF92376.1 methanol dehydrogenase [Pseudomonas sp. CFSAN084952]